jgi:hypothetical protein
MFGCIICIQNTRLHLKKLEDRGCKMIFIAYESGSKVYRMYDPVTKCVHVMDDMVFDEQYQWDWGISGNDDGLGGGDDLFTVEYMTIGQAAPETEGSDVEPVKQSPLPIVDGEGEVDNDIATTTSTPTTMMWRLTTTSTMTTSTPTMTMTRRSTSTTSLGQPSLCRVHWHQYRGSSRS